MIGAIIGDIVGSRFEFHNTQDENFELFSPECSFTDDTICTVAIYLMRSCDPFCDDLAFINALEMVATFYGNYWERHLIPRGKFDETCQGCVLLAFHIVKVSNSFEDAIRKAILYGGDSDTLGAIVGSLAKARFGVSNETIETAMSYLPKDMQKVIQKFYATY